MPKNKFNKETSSDKIEQMFKRLGLKFKYVDKSGSTSVMFYNKPINKK